MTSRLRATAAVGLLTLAALVTAGCFGGSGGTKAGGKALRQQTLVMQTPDAPDPDAEYFVEQVRKRTNGRIRVVIGASAYSSRDPDNEARLVRALRDGKEQLAYIPSRAWERASDVTAFRALQAPFLVTNYTLLRRIASGPIGRSMLASLGRIDLVGLGLVPNELRRPLSRKPLDSPAAFRGARLRVVTSPTSIVGLRALGVVPLTNFTSDKVAAAIASGELDGVESSTHSIEDNGYEHVAPYMPSNLPLFAKAQTIAIRRDVFARLAARDREALRAAAVATVVHADPAAEEKAEVQRLCRQGLQLAPASAVELASLRRAARRAYTGLERDPATRRAIHAIAAMRQGLASAAGSLRTCRGNGQSAATSSGFPEGRFSSMLTEADFERAGTRRDPGFPEPFVISIGGGRWQTNEHPPVGGRYIVRGDEVTFVLERPLENKGERETLKWSYYRGELTFRVVDVAGLGSRVIYTAHPWRRVGAATRVSRAPRFPTGTFETKITRADLRGSDFPLSDAHWETLTFFEDGTWRDVWFHPRRADQPPAGGRYTVHGDVLTLLPGNPDVLRWSYYRGLLRLEVISDPDAFGRFTYAIHPWRRIR